MSNLYILYIQIWLYQHSWKFTSVVPTNVAITGKFYIKCINEEKQKSRDKTNFFKN